MTQGRLPPAHPRPTVLPCRLIMLVLHDTRIHERPVHEAVLLEP
jgi:hypothetical protein